MLTRRAMLTQLALTLPFAGCLTRRATHGSIAQLSREDEAFLEELERASFLYFRECAHPRTGLVKDRDKATGQTEQATVASIAATGFGLSAWCIADRRGWITRSEALAYVTRTLRFLRDELPHEHGFHYHFIDWRSGERVWKCEVSSIDTALLLCGVLTCRAYFDDPEIKALATALYERADFDWMRNGKATLSHGWKPESGFLKSHWNSYCELMMLYLLALGSPTYPIDPLSWHAWARPRQTYNDLTYISDPGAPLFIHQYSHAWFDFENRHDAYGDYFVNSVKATQAHRAFCASLAPEFSHYSQELWGITASDSARGYVVWGGPPRFGRIDGTLVPCAPAGSLPFRPRECLDCLLAMKKQFGNQIWQRYGFVDAFNPATALGGAGRDRY